MKIAVYPGSFNPVTVGHLDVISRAAGLFDELIVAVGKNTRKDNASLSGEDRAAYVRSVVGGISNVEVEVMDGLLVDFARERGASVAVKGLRNAGDFEGEYEQAQLNRIMARAAGGDLETVFVPSAAEHSFLSSSMVREISGMGGDVRGMVPDEILGRVQEIYRSDTS